MNALACPRCAQLDQVQNVQSLYEAQSGVTHSTGIAAGGVGLAGPVVMATTSHGTQASNLALRLAPPPAPQRRPAVSCGVLMLFAALLGCGLFFLAGARVRSPGEDASVRLVALAIAAVFFALIPVAFMMVLAKSRTLKRGYEEYAAVWPAMMHVWRNAVICLRCHGAFFPPGGLHAGLGPSRLIPIDAFHAAVTDIGARIVLETPDTAERRLPPAPRTE